VKATPAADQEKAEQQRNFGRWFQDQRSKNGFRSQKAFAGLLGIHPVQLSRIETGASGIGKETLDKAIELLKLNQLEAYEKAGILNLAKTEDEAPSLDFTKDPDDDLRFDLEKFVRLGKDILELTLEEQQEYSRLFATIAQNVEQRVKRRKK
jgi:transcriptional regulator with XRE-family HTH domain